jgi:hypothetical protein
MRVQAAVYAHAGSAVCQIDNTTNRWHNCQHGCATRRGKGDHCHLDGKEVAYTFVSVDQLVEDFIKAVAARRTS